MPELSQGAVALLVTLLPGFLALRVRNFFMPARDRDLFERVSEVVAFSLIAYLFVSAFFGLDGRPEWMRFPGEHLHTRPGVSEVRLDAYLQALVVASVVLGIVVGAVEAHDLHYRLARLFRITNRSGLRDVWQEAFSRNRAHWVLVHLADGRQSDRRCRQPSHRRRPSSRSQDWEF